MAKGNPQMPYQVPDLRDVKEYDALLKEIEKRTKKITDWKDTAKSKQSQLNKQEEKRLAITQKIYDIEGKRESLLEKSKNLQGTILNQLSKQTTEGKDLATQLEDAAKSGNVAFVEAGNNFADLLQKVNAGVAGPAEIAQALATTDFGKFEGSVKEIFKTMKKTPSLQSILKVKSETFSAIDGLFGGMLKTIRGIMAAAGPIGLLIAAIGLVVKYLVDTVKRGIELRRELGTSAVATAKIQINMEKAAFAAAMYGGTMQQGRDAVKALVDNGADVNLKSMGLTPLMFAARHNKSKIATLLIENGAKLKAKSTKGYTALKYAEISGAKDSFKVIKKAIETQKALKKRKRRQVI